MTNMISSGIPMMISEMHHGLTPRQTRGVLASSTTSSASTPATIPAVCQDDVRRRSVPLHAGQAGRTTHRNMMVRLKSPRSRPTAWACAPRRAACSSVPVLMRRRLTA